MVTCMMMRERGSDTKQGCMLYRHHEARPGLWKLQTYELRGCDGTAYRNCMYDSAAVYNGGSRYGKMAKQSQGADAGNGCGKRNVTMPPAYRFQASQLLNIT